MTKSKYVKFVEFNNLLPCFLIADLRSTLPSWDRKPLSAWKPVLKRTF